MDGTCREVGVYGIARANSKSAATAIFNCLLYPVLVTVNRYILHHVGMAKQCLLLADGQPNTTAAETTRPAP